jgi:hypothetical protein
MARNGSGTYNLPAGNPVVTGTTISSTWANNTLSDIATALTGSLSADGQTTPTGNLPMGGYKHTNVADATVRAQYASAGQVQDSAFTFLTSPAGTNTITATAALGMSAYVTGQRFFFVAAASNTGAVTLNINAIGAKSVTKNGTTALVSGDIAINAVVQVVYDGTQFQLLNPASVAANVSSFSAGTTGLTPNTATTGAVTLAGTLAVANGGTGLATLTANNVMLGNGTSTPSFVAPSTNGNVLTSNGTTWTSAAISSQLTLMTAQATTSGTSKDFTSIPSSVKRITVMFNGVSTNGTSVVQIQIGSGSVTTTGYLSYASAYGSSTSFPTTSATSGFVTGQANSAAVSTRYGTATITNINGNSWIFTSILADSASNVGAIMSSGGGSITLGGILDRIRITTVNGTDAFDAGLINILYE